MWKEWLGVVGCQPYFAHMIFPVGSYSQELACLFLSCQHHSSTNFHCFFFSTVMWKQLPNSLLVFWDWTEQRPHKISPRAARQRQVMQMNHRLNTDSHCELKQAEAFKYLENILIVLQKKKSLTTLIWAFLNMCIYNGRNLFQGTLLSAKLLQDPACGHCWLLSFVSSSNLSRNSYLLMNWLEIIAFPLMK